MTLNDMIRQLREELERVNRVIASMEQLQAEGAEYRRKRRGRKFMAAAERTEVSQRMRKYWARRRAERSANG